MKKHGLFFLLILSSFILMHPVSVLSQYAPPHITDPFDGTQCLNCHELDGSGYGLLPVPRGAEQEQLCKTCHNPDGTASAMSNISNHVVNGGNTIIDCGSCHDPHAPQSSIDPHTGTEAYNIKLIRADTAKYYMLALEPAIFQEAPDHFAFDEDNPPWNGICQTCHTQTNHHTNDDTSDHYHKTGNDCTRCHSHENGFLPSGGCGGSRSGRGSGRGMR